MPAVTVKAVGAYAFIFAILNRIIAVSLYQCELLRRVNIELRRLLRVRSLLQEAERRQINDDSLTLWLKDLKEAAYEADDLLDDYETEVLRLKMVRGCCSYVLFAINYYNLAQKIVEIKNRFDEITQEREINLSQLDHGTKQLDVPVANETSSLVREPYIVGRTNDKENIIRLLLASRDRAGSSTRGISVLPIVGLGGIGKTTLAQLVFRDVRVEQYFQLRIWVCVSDDFNVKRILKEMIGYVSNESTGSTNLNKLQQMLMEKLRGKRFLLVLDDVWNEDRVKWESLYAPLILNHGSTVIVTTQNGKVADLVGTMNPYHLKGLSDDDHWALFSGHALSDGEADENPKLEEIGRVISRNMKGLPYGAKVLGHFLRSKKDENSWREISESEIWQMSSSDTDILSAIRSSFEHLTPHLKLCFGFCSLFPKGYRFKKEKLVQMWMASNLIQPQQTRRMEDIGNEYFDELMCRSFFQNDGSCYVMHDLIHELARSVSSDEYVTIGYDTPVQIPPAARHLSWCRESLKRKHWKNFKQLRILLLVGQYQFSLNCAPGMFRVARRLRVLDLSGFNLKVLPSSIGHLNHLRYLGLSNTIIKRLPVSLTNLFHLQTLQLENCNRLTLPGDLCQLIKLRHINANAKLVAEISNIGRLTELQELKLYRVHNKKGQRINQLRYLNQLRGHLSIEIPRYLHHRGPLKPKLYKKQHLTSLGLKWVDTEETTELQNFKSHDEVLESLKPHANLKELTIMGYDGIWYPQWMTDEYLHDIEVIRLSNCRRWQQLPPLRDFSFLKHLELQQISPMKQIRFKFFGMGFPMLETLRLYDMPELRTWQEDEHFGSKLSILSIKNCPGLTELPSLPPSLRELTISNVGLVALPGFVEFNGFSENKALTSLSITKCRSLTSLCEGLLQHHLSALESLYIANCESLSSLPEGGFRPAANLDVRIVNCPMLTSLPQWIRLDEDPLSPIGENCYSP